MVEICEVGPRDGLQNLQRIFSLDERADLIQRLAACGLQRIEAVSFVNASRVPAMADAELVLERIDVPDSCRLSGLVMNERGADRALATRLHELRYVAIASETLSVRNQGAGTESNLETFARIAPTVQREGKILTAVVAAAFGCPFEGEVDPARVADIVRRLRESGADEIVLADTIGVAVPGQVRALAERCRQHLGAGRLGFHFHNTHNTGFANAVAAIEAGANVLDASVGGLGGCPFAPGASGNIATEDLVYLLHRETVTGADAASTTSLPDREALVRIVDWLAGLVPDDISGMMRKAGPFPRQRAKTASDIANVNSGAPT